MEDTLRCLIEMRAVESLIVFEQLDVQRCVVKNPQTEVETVVHLRPDQERDTDTHLRD